jgi:ParB-like chromosome segregation protein Spo0J
MKLERAKLDALTCDPANVRKHDQRNLDAIKGSLQRFGQQHPIIVDGDGIIRAGNGRYMAMRALGWSECDIVRTALKGAEATAFAIADNRTAELASWDDEALAQQLAALQIEDEELALATGYDESEIESLAGAFDVDAIDAPDLPEGDRQPFRQMTFTVHDEQHALVEQAMRKAKDDGGSDSSLNENSNGNALAHICKAYLNG